MQKNWYIKCDDYHKGPYSSNELKILMQTGVIDNLTLVWRQGQEDWIQIAKTREFGKTPPPYKKVTKAQAEPPPIPLILKKRPTTPKLQIQLPSLPTEEDLFTDYTPEKKHSFIPVLKYMVGISAASAILILIMLAPNPVILPPGIPTQHQSKLLSAIKDTNTKTPRVEYTVDLNNNKIVMATNFKGTLPVVLTIRSIKNSILSMKPVLITTSGLLKNNIVTFNELNFQKNTKPYSGHYTFMVEGIYGSKKFSNRQIKLIGLNSEVEFSKRLKSFKQKIAKHRVNYYQDFNMVVQTYLGLLHQLQDAKNKVAKTRMSKWKLRRFERRYLAGIGAPLTSIIVDSEKKYPLVNHRFKELGKELKSITNLGKKIAKITSQITIFAQHKNKSKKLRTLDSRINKLLNFSKKKIDFYSTAIKTQKTKITL